MLDSTLRWKKSCLTFTTYYSCSIQHLKYIFIKFVKIAKSNKRRIDWRYVLYRHFCEKWKCSTFQDKGLRKMNRILSHFCRVASMANYYNYQQQSPHFPPTNFAHQVVKLSFRVNAESQKITKRSAALLAVKNIIYLATIVYNTYWTFTNDWNQLFPLIFCDSNHNATWNSNGLRM